MTSETTSNKAHSNGVATGTGVSLPAGKTGYYATYAAGAWFGGSFN